MDARRGFEETRRHLDLLSRLRRDAEALAAIVWRGGKPGLVFVVGLRCLPIWLRPAARRFAALVFVAALLWGLFLSGWEVTVDGQRWFRPAAFFWAHRCLFAAMGLTILALVALPPQRQWRRQTRDAEAATTQEGDEGRQEAATCVSMRRRLPLGQERALRAAAAEVVGGGGGAVSNAACSGALKGSGGGGGGGGAAVAASAAGSSGQPSGLATPMQHQHQHPQQFSSTASSASSTPRRSPRLHNAHHQRRQHPPSPGLASVAEGQDE